VSLILACDLGGSGLRAALVDEAGAVVASRRIADDAVSAGGGAAEADPEAWWQAFAAAAEPLIGEAPREAIAAVAVTAFTRTQVLVDRDGRPVRPAILWSDTRAEAIHADLAALRSTGHPEAIGLNAFHPLARLLWLRRTEPAVFSAAGCVLDPKDYLNLRLTGQAASDPVSLARLAAAAAPSEKGESLLAAAGLDPALMPPLLPPVSAMGRVRPGLHGKLGSLAGLPVVTMGNDTWASVVGLGAMRPGLGYNLTGTTEVLGIVGARPGAADGLLTVDWRGEADGPPLWQIGGPSQAGGDTLVWLTGVLSGAGGGSLDHWLAQPRAAEPLLFLPHLQGERVPWWDPALRGAFLGLGRRHGPADLAFAALEGIAFLNRLVLERAEAAAGAPVAEIRFGGGGARNALWRQIKADVLGRPVVSVAGADHGLAGAAITAWTALGRFPGLATAQRALVKIEERHEPRPEKAAAYDKLYALWRAAGEAVAPLSRELAGMRAP
jgi:xylulokinase